MMHVRKKEKSIVYQGLFTRETLVGLRTAFYGKKSTYHTIKIV